MAVSLMSRTIDAHHHLWRYSAAEYDWIDESMALLRRDFLAGDLERELIPAGVDAAVAVQARQTVEETQWLLQIAAQHESVAGVVGWVPLIDRGVGAVLERFSGERKLKAVRHVLQGEPDEYMLTPEFQHGIALLAGFDLAYDILVHERQLGSAIQLADRNPKQVFVLDHMAKPLIRARVQEPWGRLIRELAARPNVYCKISGMVTEADWATWSAASLAPYIDAALEAFGPRRLMYGSDWPVCLLASSYARWIGTVRQAVAHLSEDEQSWIMGRTAEQAYKLASPKEE